MDKKADKKEITLTEEQASRAAETILNTWLRSDDNNSTYSISTKNDIKTK